MPHPQAYLVNTKKPPVLFGEQHSVGCYSIQYLIWSSTVITCHCVNPQKKTALTSWTWMNPNHISSICILFIKHQPSSILPSPFLAQPFLYQTQPLFDGLRAGLDFLDTVVVGWWSLKGAQRCWWINMVMIEDVEKKWWGAGHMNPSIDPFIYIVVQYVEFKCMIMCIYICIQVVLKDRCCFFNVFYLFWCMSK